MQAIVRVNRGFCEKQGGLWGGLVGGGLWGGPVGGACGVEPVSFSIKDEGEGEGDEGAGEASE